MPLQTAALLCGLTIIYLEVSQQRLARVHRPAVHVLVYFDILAAGCSAALAAFLLLHAFVIPEDRIAFLAGAICSTAVFLYLQSEMRRAHQFQRPEGIVSGQFLFLAGAIRILLRSLENSHPLFDLWSLTAIIAGGLLIGVVVPRFLKKKEEHRIIERFAEQGESHQREWAPSTAECPRPERWEMLDSMSAELEVLDFLKQLVITLKPALIVETGTFIGASTIKMAEGLQANGPGKIVSCEYDPLVFARALERIQASGLGSWIDARNESSLEMNVEGEIDLFFSDSHLPIREQEIRRFLPQIKPEGLILMHDTSSHFKIAREAAFRLEKEGLISMVLLPTPRGLMIAQKRVRR